MLAPWCQVEATNLRSLGVLAVLPSGTCFRSNECRQRCLRPAHLLACTSHKIRASGDALQSFPCESSVADRRRETQHKKGIERVQNSNHWPTFLVFSELHTCLPQEKQPALGRKLRGLHCASPRQDLWEGTMKTEESS